MEIFLVRHGHALDDAPGLGDTGRWLSDRGRRTTRKVGRWLGKNKKRRTAAIWTSPLVSAVQTAEILAARSGFKGEVRAAAELGPGRDPGDLLTLLGTVALDGPLLLVGHEPLLSQLAVALLGDVGLGPFRKSGVVGVLWEEGRGHLRFVLDPVSMKAARKLDAPKPAEPAALPKQSAASAKS